MLKKTCTKCGTINEKTHIIFSLYNCHSCGKNRIYCSCKSGFELCPDHPLLLGETVFPCSKCGTQSDTYHGAVISQCDCHSCGECHAFCYCTAGITLCPDHPANHIIPTPPCSDCGDCRCVKEPNTNKCLCPQCGKTAHPGKYCTCFGCGLMWHEGACINI